MKEMKTTAQVLVDCLEAEGVDWAQEILTKDRVGIRVTLTAFTRIVDPEKAALASSDVNATLYRLVQFAIREAVAARTRAVAAGPLVC